MPEGTCKECGRKYYGWALQQPEHRVCDCGGEIEVTATPPTKVEEHWPGGDMETYLTRTGQMHTKVD